ncbi:MAG: alpha/beta hydrolase [Parvularculaceae bacterium]|nr:alpha/beta hydrolase [Parvularculaceae bacterium]
MRLESVVVGDGVRLSVAHFSASRTGLLPVLCIPGLTRNLKDFSELAAALARSGRDVYALSLPGRGLSDHARDPARYHAAAYRDDVLAAMDALGVARAVLVGTSLGGIVSLLLNAAAPERVAGIVLNDVGVRLAPEGIARILGYVTAAQPEVDSLDAAAAQIRALNEVAFPGRDADFWKRFALRTFRAGEDGRWRLDYDPRIGAALLNAPPVDLPAAFALTRGKRVSCCAAP